MPKHAISVTLDSGNLTWLKGRVGASGFRSISELLDQLVTAARLAGRLEPARSVVGTIEIDAADPALESADTALHSSFDASLRGPLAVRARRNTQKALRRRPSGRG